MGRIEASTEREGVWRTMPNGRKVFIHNGLSVEDAIAKHEAARPNWKRMRFTKGIGWTTPDGKPVPAHIKELGTPPAWFDARYNPKSGTGMMVSGYDAKGRLQRLYSLDHHEKQAALKFAKVKDGLKRWEQMEAANTENLSDPALREQAACTRLIMETGLRPGGDYGKIGDHVTYGATTLEGRHVTSKDGKVTLDFVGKHGQKLSIPVNNPSTAKDLLFRARKAGSRGKLFDTSDSNLRKYTEELTSGRLKPKDFRTMLGTSEAIGVIKTMPKPKTADAYKKQCMTVAKVVAKRLGNTPKVALKSYISPFAFSTWREPGW